MGRIGRSFQLAGESYRVLMQDKELMLLPLASGAIIAVVVAAAGLGFAVGLGLEPERLAAGGRGAVAYVPIFLTYVLVYAISIFFQAAVVAGATERLRGGDPTVRSALSAAGRRIGPIMLWAVVAGTAGMLIRLLQERVPFVGKIVAGIGGAAWSLATFFVVPILVLEERSIPESFSRSVRVFKQTWGETVVGGANLGVAAACAWATLVAIVGLLSYVVGLAALVVLFAGAVVLTVLFSALQGIYQAALFRYALFQQATKHGPWSLDANLLQQAFVPRPK
jgi:Family of unknown function (DUF6159)